MSARFPLALVLIVLAISLGNRSAIAHDIPKQRVDRTIQLRFEPNRLHVEYILELDDTTIAADLKRIRPDKPLPAEPEEWLEAYGRLVAPLITRALLIDGPSGPMNNEWLISSISRSREQHSIYEFQFVTHLREPGNFRFRDENFGTSDGLSRLGVDWRNSVVVRSDGDYPRLATDRQLQPHWMLEDEEIRKTKQWCGNVEWGAAGEISPTATSESIRRITASERKPKSTLGFIGAFLLGLWHTLQPGHGKTWLAAASLRASRSGRQGASLLFGWILSHFAVILLLALLAQVLDSGALVTISVGLKQLAGLLIAAPAAHRLGGQLRRFQSSERVRFSDPNANAQDVPERSISRANGLSAGLTAGLVPCWEAVGLLLLGLSAGHPAQGLKLVAAFIAGGVVVVVSAISFAGILVPKVTYRRFMGYAFLVALDIVVLVTGLNLLILRSVTSTADLN